MPITERATTERRRNNNLKHFDLCFSNLFTHESPPTTPNATSSSHHHQNINHNRPSHSSTTSSIINFNTLYEPDPEPEPKPVDIATAFASQRFFFSSPGRSNSIIDSTNTYTDTDTETDTSSLCSSLTVIAPPPQKASTSADDNNDEGERRLFFDGIVAVPTYSTDPYVDFRRSMQEMVEARPEVMMDVKSNWHVLHELLLCYLALNPTSTHKYIHGAFSDLLVALTSYSSCILSHPPPHDVDRDDVTGGSGGGV